METIMSDTAVIVNIVILVLLIAWSLLDDVIQKKSHENTNASSQMNAFFDDLTVNIPMISMTSKKMFCSFIFWVKTLIVLQGLTLVFTILNYFKS